MSIVKGLHAPQNLTVNIKPSAKQYELWNLLQPNCCPHCGGTIQQAVVGINAGGEFSYKPQCANCKTYHLPRFILGGGAAGGGKAESLDSEIITPFGVRRFGDLKVGDTVTSAITGGVTEVVALHPIETRDYYRLNFVDGTSVDCSDNHIWMGHFSRGKKSKRAMECSECFEEHGSDGLILTHQLYDWYQKEAKGSRGNAHFTVPLCKPVRFAASSKQHVNPYVAAAMIANGCVSGTATVENKEVTFIAIDDDVVDRMIGFGAPFKKDEFNNSGKAKTFRTQNREFIESLDKSEIRCHKSPERFIPGRYKLGTIEDRILLMRGFMDTGGHVDGKGRMSYRTESRQLAEDVAFVVRSLGGVATVTKKENAGCRDKDGVFARTSDAYNVRFSIENAPDLVCTERKRLRARHGFNGSVQKLGKRVVSVEYIGKKEGRCITVKEPSGVYLTNGFTVTHNSWLGSNWICSLCVRFPDIRCVIARKTIKSLKESTFNTVKSILNDWGLREEEHYRINNMENWLKFWNGSVIYLKELELQLRDPNFERLGSTEISAAFVDEVSEISERAIEVLMSRCRWKIAEHFGYPRLLMTTNPCATWVRDRFVQDSDGNPVELNPSDAFVKFSVYDNPCKEFVQVYENNLKNIKDPATRARLLYGNWDFVDTNDVAAYWKFNGDKHLVGGLKEQVYNPLKPIINSWDFNVLPFMSTLSLQIDYDSKKIYVLDEILGKPESRGNNTPKLSQKIKDKYLTEKHLGGLFITGDPAGLARSTQTEYGVNNYTIILNNLNAGSLRAQTKLLSKQPPQVQRLDFINSLLEGFDGWEIKIDMRCRKLTEDLMYQKKNGDGTKNKKKVVDPKTGLKYEKYGHLSDCLDYALCMFMSDSWNKFRRSNRTLETSSTPIYGTFNF